MKRRPLLLGAASLLPLLGSGRTAGAQPAATAATAAPKPSPWADAQPVPRAQIADALCRQQALGYRLDAIANAMRMQTGMLLALADAAASADPAQRPLRIDHRDFFAAYLEVTGLTAERAPSFIRAPHAAREDYLVDARLHEVLDLAATRDRPLRALNVKAGWPASASARASYSYEDRSTDPAIETTRQQLTSWRILDYGDSIVYDDVEGVSGRATSGLLGAIFSLIGHAQARQTRYAIAPDGLQVSSTTARKRLTISQTVTITPEGKVITGLPEGRSDLGAIEKRLLDLPLGLSYRPMDRSPMPPPPVQP